MLYLVYLEDIEDNVRIRQPLLEQHMKHIGGHIGSIRLAGPLMRADGKTQAGGVLLIEATSAQEVRGIIDADPYFQAGLWPEVKIHEFREIINGWKSAAPDPA
jgi:uncharacterized protein YciI